MKLTNLEIKKILLDGAYVNPDDLEKAIEYARDNHVSIEEYLFANELITKDLLGQAAAEYFNIPYIDLNSKPLSKKQILKIPEELAEKFRVVLFAENQNDITIVTDGHLHLEVKTELEKIFPGKKINFSFSLSEDIDAALSNYRQTLNTRFTQIIKNKGKIAPEILDEIFEDSLNFKASDIHFEPQKDEVIIRFRIDGVLHEAGRLAKEYYENILNRIKVQARLRIDEHFSTQDGAIRYEREEETVDMRISIIPVMDGEKISIRLLAQYAKNLFLKDLGLSAKDQKLAEKISQKPFGMILVAGPTGSGKTTTLYALLKTLNCKRVNVTTIEDPVEYRLAGINQIQVNLQTNLTFNRGLRSIIRQDPDIILVGEIRDEETAEIAVNAALTGHLLFSTFHANDAATVAPRLLDMGIEPFLLSSTLEAVIGQRLVRKICEECRYSVLAERNDLKKILSQPENYFSEKTITLYKGKGCSNCANTGYRGRTAIFEFIEITEQIQNLILKNPSSGQIWELARQQGAGSLFEDGIEKVKNGVTTLEELLRVAEPPAAQ